MQSHHLINHANNNAIMKRIKIYIVLLLVFKSNFLISQKNNDFIIHEIILKQKSKIYSTIKMQAFDITDKQKVLPIIRVDKVSFIQNDTTVSIFLLSKGKHKIQIGWVGYEYSSILNLKVNLSRNYNIQVFLKPKIEYLE